jgi:CBS domain-containing protein
MGEILVSDIMTRDPITVDPNASLLECARKMVRKRVGNLLIVSGKRLVGLISDQDIMWVLVKQPGVDLSKIKAIDISPRKIATVKPSYSIKDTINKMKKLKFQRLPVIHQGELAGIISVKDILNFHPEFYPEYEEIENIREQSEKLKRLQKAKERKIEGMCERCGKKDFLNSFNGMLVCDSCQSVL